MHDNQPKSNHSDNSRKNSFHIPYPEATASSIIFGLIFGIFLNASITYAGLKIGFTIVGSAIGAVVGFGVLRGILRRGSILEVNISQTIASAVNAATPGIIFTVPVLYLLYGQNGMTPERFWMVTVAGVVGGILGVAFIIPLRKQMIDIDRLRFPQGTAVASILKSPGAGPKKAMVLLAGVVVAALIYLPVELPNLQFFSDPAEPSKKVGLPGYAALNWRLSDPRTDPNEPLPRWLDRDGDNQTDLVLNQGRFDVGRLLGMPDYMLFVLAITPLSFGAGYLTGRPGLMVLAGGVLAYWVLNPIAYALGWFPTTMHADTIPRIAQGTFNRPLGIGMLIGGAFMGVVAALPAIRAALGSIAAAKTTKQGRDELGLLPLGIIIVISTFGLFIAADLISSGGASGGLLGGLNPHLRNAILAIVGSVWIWFAGIIIAQCTGMTDWSPVSGIALLTVVLVMFLAGTGEVVAAVLFGAALCVAIAAAADLMADLKTGYLVGAKPIRQQVLEMIGVCLGPIVTMTALFLIVNRNMILVQTPIGPGTDTTAPQAQALQAVITGVQQGDMPYTLYGGGAILGILLGLGSFPGLGVLVGLSMYLPLEYVLTYGVGCVTNMLVARIKGKAWAEEWGVPFCAGLIVGEAMLAMIINIVIVGHSLASG